MNTPTRTPPWEVECPNRVLAYFDTIEVFFSGYVWPAQRKALVPHCRNLRHDAAGSCGKAGPWLVRRGYRSRIGINGLTHEGIDVLDTLTQTHGPILITRVDCALDLIPVNGGDVSEWERYLDDRLYKPYHRPRHQGRRLEYGTTTYIRYDSKLLPGPGEQPHFQPN